MYLADLGIRIDKVADHTTAGTGDVNSTGVDMSQDGGYSGVRFITSYGTANANNILKTAQSDDDGSGDAYSELESTAQQASGASDEDVSVDIFNPLKRWVRAVAERGTSSTLESIHAIRYGPRDKAVTAVVAGTGALTQVSSPAEA